jgi:hypothetical protein
LRDSALNWQLEKLQDIESNLSTNGKTKFLAYTWLKAYTNFIKKMTRQHKMKSAALRIRRIDGKISGDAKSLTQWS